MYYLHHYFDPDPSLSSRLGLGVTLRPTPGLTRNQGPESPDEDRKHAFVQNVVAGQILAELLNPDQRPELRRDPRFLYKTRHLPIGPNCLVHPDNPNIIIAAVNGYVLYQDGLICVKQLLNLRTDVGFHTGNIFFVNDLAIYGDVHTGFSVQARNILIKGEMQSARLKSIGDLVCLGGIKGVDTGFFEHDPVAPARSGGYAQSPLAEAGGDIRLPFCEQAQLRAGGDIIIDGSCLHCAIYAGGNLLVKGCLQGGAVYANGIVRVQKQLGNDSSAPTRITTGYDPFVFLRLHKLESQIHSLADKLAYFQKMAARNTVMRLEYAPRIEIMRRKLAIARSRYASLRQELTVDENKAAACRIIVPGQVMPDCEIRIGKAVLKTTVIQTDVHFRLSESGKEILSRPNKGRVTDETA